MSIDRKRLAIIILNYKTPTLTINCLRSLQNQIQPDSDKIIIVDNASNDGSVEQINQAIGEYNWQSWTDVLSSSVNGGFSAGNNLGINAINAEAYLLLNSDTLIQPGALNHLLTALEKHPEAGLIGPQLTWPDGSPQNSCFRYPTPLSELIKTANLNLITQWLKTYEIPIKATEQSIEPQWISFACVLIRRHVIEQVGLLDAGYFMYFEDADYCWQVHKAGWKIRYWPLSKVTHLRGASGPVQKEVERCKRPRSYLYASRNRLYAKCYGQGSILRANFYWHLGRCISFIREIVGTQKPPHICEYEDQDIWINWRDPLQHK